MKAGAFSRSVSMVTSRSSSMSNASRSGTGANGVTRAFFISSILLLSIPLRYLMTLVLASFDAVRKVEEKGMFSFVSSLDISMI